jgi:uroporphyrinogen-III synthase
MAPRILITRTEPEPTAARVRALGGEALPAPVLSARDVSAVFDPEGVQALLFTSVNGVRAFARQLRERSSQALCVGDATAQAARDAGFGDVRAADGDAEALAAFAARTLQPTRGRVVHVCGADIALDLTAILRASGYASERCIVYETAPASALPAEIVRRLASVPPGIDLVLFHSRRAAQVFCALAQDAAPDATRTLIAACLSPRVAEGAAGAAWRDVIVAPAPREEALLAAAFGAVRAEA